MYRIDDPPTVKNFRAKTEQLFKMFPSKATIIEIEELILNYINTKIEEYSLEVQIVNFCLTGSRSRGLEYPESDLDFVLEYRGSLREDVFFDILHEDNLAYWDAVVDINPIKADKSGDIMSYLICAEDYLERKRKFNEEMKEIWK